MMDFHSHILPCIDDGAKSPKVALEMLKQAAGQGIETIVATPHFNYDDISVEEFEKKRYEAIQLLEKEKEKSDISLPEILPAAEVYLLPGTAAKEDISRLCIQGTDCILIELPVGEWTGWVFNEIYTLRTKNLIPVLAHLERYISPKTNIKKIDKLLEMEVCVQINADDVKYWRYKGIIKKFMRSGLPVVLGSDSHNTDTRANKTIEALGILRKRFGRFIDSELEENAMMLISDDFSF